MVQWSNCDFDCGCTQRQCPSPAREGGAWDCYQHTVPGESGMKSDESPEVSKKTCQVLTSQLWTEHRDRVSTKSDKPTCFCSEHPPKAISFKSQISSSSVSSPLKSARKALFFWTHQLSKDPQAPFWCWKALAKSLAVAGGRESQIWDSGIH